MDRRAFVAGLGAVLAAPFAEAQAEADCAGIKPIALRVATAPAHLKVYRRAGVRWFFKIRSVGAPT
jgi:hypothetical protein